MAPTKEFTDGEWQIIKAGFSGSQRSQWRSGVTLNCSKIRVMLSAMKCGRARLGSHQTRCACTSIARLPTDPNYAEKLLELVKEYRLDDAATLATYQADTGTTYISGHRTRLDPASCQHARELFATTKPDCKNSVTNHQPMIIRVGEYALPVPPTKSTDKEQIGLDS